MSSPATTPSPVPNESNAVLALLLGLVSPGGLVFPPLGAVGVAAIVIGWISHRRIVRSQGKLKGNRIALAGVVMGAIGTLLSLALPAFIFTVLVYSLFHGGQLPAHIP